jgi:hypothetical protein
MESSEERKISMVERLKPLQDSYNKSWQRINELLLEKKDEPVIEYTSEDIKKLREQAMKIGIGYISDKGLIEFDKAVRASMKEKI